MSAATAPASLAPAGQASVSFTVANKGAAATAASTWYDSLYLSDNQTFDAQATYVASFYRGAPLAAGASYTVTQTVTLPSTANGRYLLFASDATNAVPEDDETNNVRAVTVTVAAADVDLTVTASSAPATLLLGSQVSLSWTVTNQGTTPAPAKWSDAVYLSDRATLDATATRLTENQTTASLAAGGSYTVTKTVTVPITLATGNHYLLFATDAYGEQGERDEGNNVRAVPVSVTAPNFAVTDASAPATSTPSKPVTLSWTVTNQGNATATTGWYDYVYLSDKTTLDNSATAVASQYIGPKLPLPPGGSYTLTQTVNLPDSPAGSRYLLFVANGDFVQRPDTFSGGVVESDLSNNVKAVPITITLPDLAVTDASAPASAFVGDSITVAYTVLNQGTAATSGGWTDVVYLSDKTTLDNTATFVRGFSRFFSNPIVPSNNYQDTETVQVPTKAATGDRYLLFVANDPRNSGLKESDQSNNVKALTIRVSMPDADLVVTDVTAPATAQLGTQATVSWTVRNQGSCPAQAGSWSDYLYYSERPTLDDTAVQLTSTFTSPPLAAGASYTRSASVTFRPDFRPGDRYLLLVPDRFGQLPQSNEANNLQVVPITLTVPDVDLVVSDVTAPAAITRGQTTSISFNVTNQGHATAAGPWNDWPYVSSKPTLDSSALVLVTSSHPSSAPVVGGGSYSVTLNFTVRTDAPLGDLYLFVVPDGGSFLAESDKANNPKAVPITVTNGADLEVSAVTAPSSLILGGPAQVSWMVTNRGTGAAYNAASSGSKPWADAVYLSDKPTLDDSAVRIGTAASATTFLSAGDSYAQTVTATAPADAATGSRYLLIVSDGDRKVPLADRTKSVEAVPVTVGTTNLVVTEASAPTSAAVGGTAALSFTVTNQGTLPAEARWFDYVYLSDDATFQPEDTLVGVFSRTSSGALKAGESYTLSPTVTLPAAANPGSRYLLFVADRDNVQGETNDADNVRAVPIDLVGPDLAVTSVTAPDTLNIGSPVNVSWTVTNLGSGAADGGWGDNVYLSPTPTLGPSSVRLIFSSVAAPSSLAPGDSYTRTQLVQPSSLSAAGDYYLLVVADDGMRQGDPDRGNNVKAVPIRLGRADLAATAFTAPSSAVAGGSVTLSWTVENLGDVPAPGFWSDAVYLQDSPTAFQPTAVLLTSAARFGLEAGGRYTVSQNVFIPANVKGGDRYLVFRTDANGQVPDLNFQAPDLIAARANNSLSLPITITGGSADLTVTTASGPSAGVEGQTVRVEWTVTNRGGGATAGAWSDAVYLSDKQTLDASATLLTRRAVGAWAPLAGGGSYTLAENVVIPNAGTGARYLLFVADDDRGQAETDAGNNVRAVPISVTGRQTDLEITAVSAPASAVLGGGATISFTVTNRGAATAVPTWTDAVYLSDRPTLGMPAPDPIFGGVFVQRSTTLEPGGTYTVQLSIPILGRPTYDEYYFDPLGDRYLLFVADNANQLSESDKANNVRAVPITVRAPDLVVSALSATGGEFPGDSVTVAYTVTNQGAVDTLSQYGVSDALYVSDGPTTQGNAALIGTLGGPPLAAGASYTVTSSAGRVTLPASTRPGPHYLVVATDSSDSRFYTPQPESDETNNLRAVPLNVERAPDLVVTAVSSPGMGVLGGQFAVSYTVTNRGDAPAVGSWNDLLYLSDSRASTDTAPQLAFSQSSTTRGYDLLLSGQSYTVTGTVTLPTYLQPGNRYLIFATNPGSFPPQGESDLTNNLHAVSFAVVSPADLQVTAATAPASVRQFQDGVSVSWTVKNNAAFALSGSWADAVYLSDKTFLDASATLLASKSPAVVTPPAAGGSYTVTQTFSVPGVVPGSHYLLFVSDAFSQVVETDEVNNVFALPVTMTPAVQPDLQPGAVTAPSFRQPGQAAEVTWTVTNAGLLKAVTPWVDRVYLSADGKVEGATLVAEVQHESGLDVGAQYSASATFTVPTVADGVYRYLVVTDAEDAVFEGTGEGNNVAASAAIDVARKPFADLAVSGIEAPATAGSGKVVTLSWTVVNKGIAGTDTDRWADTVVLTSDAAGQLIVGNLGSFDHNGTLAVGEGYTRTADVRLPDGISGTYYLRVQTGGPYESVHTDNNSPRPQSRSR